MTLTMTGTRQSNQSKIKKKKMPQTPAIVAE